MVMLLLRVRINFVFMSLIPKDLQIPRMPHLMAIISLNCLKIWMKIVMLFHLLLIAVLFFMHPGIKSIVWILNKQGEKQK